MNGSGAHNRSRLPPNPAGSHDDSSYNAALKGASLAFQKSTPKPLPPSTPSRNVDNRALIAATSAASASRDHSRAVSRQTTGNSLQGGSGGLEVEQAMPNQQTTQHLQTPLQRSHGVSHLAIATKQSSPDPRSPSFIAATLAASRSASPIRNQIPQSNPHVQQVVRRQRKGSVSTNNSAASSVKSLDLATDTTSIPSTNTLISMFEKKEDDTDPVKKSVEEPDNQKLLGLKPKTRHLSPPRAMSPIVKNDLSPSRLASTTAWKKASSPSASVLNAANETSFQPQISVVETRGRAPTPPPARKNKTHASTQSTTLESRGKQRASTPPPKTISQANTVILSPRPRRSASQKIILDDIRAQDLVSKGQTSPSVGSKLQPLSPVYGTVRPSLPDDETPRNSMSSNDTFVSASSVPSPQASSPQRGRSRPSSPDTVRPGRPISAQTTSTSRPPPLPRRKQQAPPSIPLESLTDAIVAGSLASSRITASAQTPPPKPPSRKQTPHMRQTLRQPRAKSDDDEEERIRRKKLVGGGKKHAHHEGARRRWREEITPRERKRYEGVWASNRGLLLVSNSSPDGGSSLNVGSTSGTATPIPIPIITTNTATNGRDSRQNGKDVHKERDNEPELSQVVVNVVVRDIWSRSRLPFDELAEVWDLVDRRGRGFLDRAEFVVGMWLVDQRLRGRKIPRKVTESVWGSASAGGVRVAPPHGKAKGKGKKK
ncbi:hypothetical protein F5Y04DRAFT_264975 [Hypomontagnella monticulosa]|nr:hypothetical protein F5Y04DRAFT_264975 [Hypomontagnella monticulosa]